MTSMRTTTAVVAAVLVFVLLCITAAQPETAYGTGTTTTVPGGAGDCSVIGGVLSCGVAVGGSPTTTVPGQVGSSTTTSAIPPTYTYTTTSDPEMIVANNLVCNPQGQLVAYSQFVPTPPYPTWNNWTTDDPLPPGYSVPYTLDQIDNATKAVTSLGLQCSAQVTTTTTLPPPSPSEAWAASIKVLPLPQIRFSPSSSGLVHLETWFWLSNDAAGVPVTVSATAGGDTIAATVEPVSYTWTFGPSAATETSYTAGSAGSGETASAVYTYLDAGTYEVSVTVGWAGSFVFEGKTYDIASPADPIDGPATFAPYEVREIRSVLTGGPG